MKPIVQEGDPILREEAMVVPEKLFTSKKLAQVVADMSEALDEEPDGVALAAPQIGLSLCIFIVRRDRIIAPAPEGTPHQKMVDVFINPEVIKTSRKQQHTDEGCLSVRGIYGTTSRHERVTIRARGIDGKSFQRGASGLLAQIFEHEIDHLYGVLFIDHAEHLLELTHADPHAEK